MLVSKCSNHSFGAIHLAPNIEGGILSMPHSVPVQDFYRKLKQCSSLQFFDVYVKEDGETYVKDTILGEKTCFADDECVMDRLKKAMDLAIDSECKLRQFLR